MSSEEVETQTEGETQMVDVLDRIMDLTREGRIVWRPGRGSSLQAQWGDALLTVGTNRLQDNFIVEIGELRRTACISISLTRAIAESVTFTRWADGLKAVDPPARA